MSSTRGFPYGPFILFHLLLVLPQFCLALENYSVARNVIIKDGDILISYNKTFALGFFSPGGSSRRYVGIWYYKVPEKTVVWVANRDNPLPDISGGLSINSHGNLVLYSKVQSFTFWSTNVSVVSKNNDVMAKLLDSGNLVLLDEQNKTLWQSFDYPTHTVLPFMKLGLDKRTGLNRFLTSWKSLDDPGIGNYSFRIEQTGYPQLFLYKGQSPRWRAGPWNGHRWSGIPAMTSNFIFNVSYVNSVDENSVSYRIIDSSIFSRMVLDESGSIGRSTWHDQNRQWIEFWSAPVEWCDKYGQCGPNGNCDASRPDNFACTCLPGFEPKSPHDWFLRDGSSGCVRKRGVSTCEKGEGFVKVTNVEVPDTSSARVNMSLSLKECEEACLRNCSCKAYTSADDSKGGIGCLTWHGDMMDTRTYTAVDQDLYVRVDAVELAQYAKNTDKAPKKGTVAILVSSGAALTLLIVASSVYWLVMKQKKSRGRQNTNLFSMPASKSPFFDESPGRTKLEGSRGSSDLPFFHLSTLAAATNNFSIANKLGEGGFGSVYKGLLADGKEIAVKRLCKYSGQGIEELKNEVTLIAKLQHRNLVRILGCCIQDEEKLLIYEYLPNKSLDSFIFDETKKVLLDWQKRFEIINGVARGILYLHQDSRLRIIHRDLKASNVLLDADLNPKIADFGMARIFGGDQIEANTKRVVGTYGYMSPEYAMEGLFSVKSDVYSFGVLLLEIISSRKNNNYFDEDSPLNLVGHVWELWKDNRALEIVDSALDKESYANEVLRCIHIGLLCVQEQATDRPTMSAIVFMLRNDVSLPTPKQPAFIMKRNYNGADPSTSGGANSVNEVTVTVLEAR